MITEATTAPTAGSAADSRADSTASSSAGSRSASATTWTTTAARLTTDDVWRQVDRASFAILAHVDAAGRPRCSGVVYATAGRRLYVAVAPDGRKARELVDGSPVSLTVPVRRGGILSLVLPIPPATISFRARAVVHPAGSLDPAAVSKAFARMLPASRRGTACVLELVPEGRFLAFGIGVSLAAMTKPEVATVRVPVA